MSQLSLTKILVISGWLLASFSSVVLADLFDKPVSSIDQNTGLQNVIGQLAQATRVRSEFRQTKSMKLLRRPLVSEGNMIFDQSYGLYWHIETPFPSELVMNEEKILQRSGDQKNSVTAQQQPVTFGFAQVFFQVLSGNIENMFQEFNLFFVQDENAWQIGLVPKNKQLRAVLAKIILTGDEDLRQVDMIDHAGDTTVIEFKNRHVFGPALSDQERALYAF